MALVTTGAFKHSIPYVYKSSFDGFVVPYLAGTALLCRMSILLTTG